MRRSLNTFTHFFVQNKNSQMLLADIGIKNVTVSGDTRFDRVAKITRQDNTLDFLSEFVRDKIVIVAGSTWPEDELLLVNFINGNNDPRLRFIIAPHNIDQKEIQKLKGNLKCKTTLYSENLPLEDSVVFIADTVGLLTRIYSYADIAYVGGGFGKEGVHNVLEPAVFGIPLVIGPIYDKFEEAVKLVELGSCLVAANEQQFSEHLIQLTMKQSYREGLGEISKSYIDSQLGATQIILKYIQQLLADIS
jgi:3-deoxy-D-manno-octulosonic-acid transferase